MIRIILKEFAPTVKTKRWPNGVDSTYKLRIQCPYPNGEQLSGSMINQVWSGEMKMIGLSTIEAICLGLDCQPGDWIIVTPGAAPKVRSRTGVSGHGRKATGATLARPARSEKKGKQGREAKRRPR